MDTDKMSRSGRKVKTPFKLQDMEVVDPITGRRSISNTTHSPSAPSVPKVKVPYTGRKRGRPPRAALNGGPSTSSHQVMYHHQGDSSESFPEEDSVDAVFASESFLEGTQNTQNSSNSRLENSNPQREFHLQTTAPDGTTVNSGVVAHLKDVFSPSGNPTAANQNALKRPRKKPHSPEEGPTPKRRRSAALKNFEGEVEIPEGFLEAMRKKRQVTAYLVFCRSERPSVMRNLPDGDFSQFSKELGNRWTKLSEEERLKWKKIAHRISEILAVDRNSAFLPERTGAFAANSAFPAGLPERSRRARDKLIRELDHRLNDPPTNSPFDLLANLNILSEQLSSLANCINFLSFTPGGQGPLGCLDAAMDSAFITFSSTLGLMAQVPVLRDSLDQDVFEELADNTGMIMPLIHSK